VSQLVILLSTKILIIYQRLRYIVADGIKKITEPLGFQPSLYNCLERYLSYNLHAAHYSKTHVILCLNWKVKRTKDSQGGRPLVTVAHLRYAGMMRYPDGRG
jgi:hypothetical protein